MKFKKIVAILSILAIMLTTLSIGASALTTESSDPYIIGDNHFFDTVVLGAISNVKPNTTIKSFVQKLSSELNTTDIKVYSAIETPISNNSLLYISFLYTVKIDGNPYKVVIYGDTNYDGLINLLDRTKINNFMSGGYVVDITSITDIDSLIFWTMEIITLDVDGNCYIDNDDLNLLTLSNISTINQNREYEGFITNIMSYDNGTNNGSNIIVNHNTKKISNLPAGTAVKNLDDYFINVVDYSIYNAQGVFKTSDEVIVEGDILTQTYADHLEYYTFVNVA